MVKDALEMLHTDRCFITESRPYTKSNGSTGQRDEPVYSDVPCRLSYGVKKSVSPSDTAAEQVQEISLFLSPDIEIRPGSKITVYRNGKDTAYHLSGQPAIYGSHQQVRLKLEQRYA